MARSSKGRPADTGLGHVVYRSKAQTGMLEVSPQELANHGKKLASDTRQLISDAKQLVKASVKLIQAARGRNQKKPM